MPRYLLDTNAVIYFFDGEEKISELLLHSDDAVCVSFITKIELLCFETADKEILRKIAEFLDEIEVVLMTEEIISEAISYRKNLKLKIPDAIIAATAKTSDLTLITADKTLTQKLKDVNTISPI